MEKEPRCLVQPAQYERALLVNATVALIVQGDTTMAEASVAREQIRWVYHYLRL